MRYLLFTIFTFFAATVLAQPVIQQISPASAPAGTQVTISGFGFSTFSDSNIVFFGPVRARVTSASATSLSVEVPFGATYNFVTVTTHQLTAFSTTSFLPASGAGDTIGSKAFLRRQDFNSGNFCYSMAFADFDGNGLTEIATLSNTTNIVRILKNTSTTATINLQSLDLALSSSGSQVAVGDINSDGKPDIIVSLNGMSTISIFLNKSTPDNFSFAPELTISTTLVQAGMMIDDIDGDGKADIIAANQFNNSVSILRNTSTDTNLSFALPVSYAAGQYPARLKTADFDGDGKRDIAVVNFNSNNISILRNTSLPGLIQLSGKVDHTTPGTPNTLAIGDLNNDGKPDLAVGMKGNSFSVFQNISTGLPSFSRKDITWGNAPMAVGIDDLDGDGRPDLVVAGGDIRDYVSIYQNNGTGPDISFKDSVNFPTNNSSNLLSIADLTNTGKPQIILGCPNQISVHYNGIFVPRISSFSPTSGTLDSVITIYGKHFTGATSVIFGGLQAKYFTVINDTIIKATLDRGFRGRIVIRNRNGEGVSESIFRYISTLPFALCTGQGGTLTGDITGNSYQWQVNTGSGYQNITDTSEYADFNSRRLIIKHATSSWYGYRYRLLADGNQSNEYILQFQNRWTGNANTSWANPANWSCTTVPDANTDVIINSGTVIIDAPVIIRSLRSAPGVQITVSSGVTLTILH